MDKEQIDKACENFRAILEGKSVVVENQKYTMNSHNWMHLHDHFVMDVRVLLKAVIKENIKCKRCGSEPLWGKGFCSISCYSRDQEDTLKILKQKNTIMKEALEKIANHKPTCAIDSSAVDSCDWMVALAESTL